MPNVALKENSEAAKGEVRLVIENGEVNKDGIPMILQSPMVRGSKDTINRIIIRCPVL